MDKIEALRMCRDIVEDSQSEEKEQLILFLTAEIDMAEELPTSYGYEPYDEDE